MCLQPQILFINDSFCFKEERVQDLVGSWVNVSLLSIFHELCSLGNRRLGKKAHLELKVTFPLNPCIFMSFCIREHMSFHRGQILSLLHTYRNPPTAGPPAEGFERLEYCYHWKWQEGKQQCCTEVCSLMWNLIEHDSTGICRCNGDELVFQVQLTNGTAHWRVCTGL